MLPLRVRVDLGALARKGYSAFLKAPALLDPHHQMVKCHIKVYSSVPADWAGTLWEIDNYKYFEIFEPDTLIQAKMKLEVTNLCLRRARNPLVTKLYTRNLTPGINSKGIHDHS